MAEERRKKSGFKYPDYLDEEKVMEKWREAVESASSLISSIFKDGLVKMMAYRELYGKLKEKGIDYDDAEDVVSEAERKKLIYYDSKTRSYNWIPEERRNEEMCKTEQLEKTIADIFIERNAKWLHRDELVRGLAGKGFSREDIERAVYEAIRDFVVDFHESEDMFRLVPKDERVRMGELRRLRKLNSKKWFYEKMVREHALGSES
jgi:SOS response regulatory protein OraA/RecX